MRILQVSAEYAPLVGGIADYTRLLALHLVQGGAEVAVLTTSASGQAGTDDEFPVFREVPRWDFGMFRHLDSVIRRFRPGVVHVQFQTGAYAMHPAVMLAPDWLLRQHADIPSVTTFHDVRKPYLFPKAHLVRAWLMRRFARRSTATIVTNAGDGAELRRMGPSPAVIPLGSSVPNSRLPAFTRGEVAVRWGVPAECPLLGFFGMLNHSKGFDTLLQAVRIMDAEGTPPHVLVIGERFGDSDPTNRAYGAAMEALATRLGLTDRIAWTGHLPAEEVSRALRALDICVLPFRTGATFGRSSLVAALANGVPIVTTQAREQAALDSTQPHLIDGRHVLLAPVDDAAGMADACMRLLRSTDLRDRLSTGAFALGERFSWDGIAGEHMALYRTISSASQPVAV